MKKMKELMSIDRIKNIDKRDVFIGMSLAFLTSILRALLKI